MSDAAASIGERIKQLRLEKNMTQSELAGSFITRNMLSRIENGFALPSLNTLFYVAEKLGVPAGILLGDGEENRLFRKSRSLPEIRSAYDAGDWLICRDLCRGLEGGDDEISLIDSLCTLNAARESFNAGSLRGAAELFTEAGSIAAGCRLSGTVKETSDAYLSVISDISPTAAADADSQSYISPASFADPFCRYYYHLRLSSGDGISGYEGTLEDYIQSAGPGEAPYMLHITARISIAANDLRRASGLMKDILSGNGELPAPMLYFLFSDLEDCSRELGDFKAAYEYSGLKRDLYDRLIR